MVDVSQIAEILRTQEGPFDPQGRGSGIGFRLPSAAARTPLRYAAFGVAEAYPLDQVAVVEAGSDVEGIQADLKKHGQIIPLGGCQGLGYTKTIGGSISMNLPHPLEGKYGSWRDWVLGMTVILANGDIVECGSKAVKNVAGYDLHKLFIGARGTLGVIARVILRTYPLASFQDVKGDRTSSVATLCIQRTKRADFQQALAQSKARVLAADEGTCTLWLDGEPAARYDGDWVLCANRGEENVRTISPAHQELMKRLKRKFDPTEKLNPGEFGFL